MATFLRIYCKHQSGILSLKSLLNIQSTRNYWPTYENKRKECHDKEEEELDRVGRQRKSTTSQEMTP